MNTFNITGNVVKIYDNIKHIKVVIADNYLTEQGEQRVNYIPVCVFGRRTDFIKKYISVGDHVQATGKIGTYKSNTGAEHITLMSSDLSFCGYKNPHKKADTENNKVENDVNFITIGGEDNDELPWEQ